MRFYHFMRALAPVAAIAIAASLSGCDKAHINIDGEEGKPLSELDLTGDAPGKIVLLGPDEVRITAGAKLAITVAGEKDITDAMRFTLKDGTLGILRKNGHWNNGGIATVNIIMPAPAEITVAGSGTIHATTLAKDAKVVIAGSGNIETPNVIADSLDVTIAGTGSYRAAGNAASIKLSIVGSGDATMDALKAGNARINIAGPGSSAFASDGDVTANIIGSGEVRVRGRATCKVSAAGSGRLVCEPAAE